METLFYSLFSIVSIGWLHRYLKVRQLSDASFFIYPDTSAPTPDLPEVSVLIPARNEEKNIGRCLESFVKQDYPKLEIIVVDDRSTDKTAQIVTDFSARHNNIKLLQIRQCPEGWSGKNHAITRGMQIARGKYLIFTDADTYHYPYCVKSAVKYAIDNKVDLLSINPHLVTKSFWENVIMPVAGAVLMIWYPLEKINNGSGNYSYANGQFILFNHETYSKIGGHSSVKEELLEDLALARKIKQENFNLKVLWGPQVYQTHMYSSLKEIWRGWVRIFYHGFQKNLGTFCLSLLLMMVFSISPYILAVYSVFLLPNPVPIILTGVLYGFLVFTIVTAYRLAKSNKWYVLTHLLGCLMVTAILIHSASKIIFKRKITWRGTSYSS